MTTMIRTILLSLLFISNTSAKSIHYDLSMSEPHTHLFEVEMRLEGARGTEVVALPVWTPGSYLIREYAKNVQDISARSEDDTILKIKKIDKNHWQVKGKGSQDIIVTYRVYAFEHSVRTSYLNADHALVVPASVLMYWQKNQRRKHHLHINMPDKWSEITTALEPFNKPGNVDFIAKDYDELVDSPLELGNQHVVNFEVLGKPHVMALYGASNYDDSVLISDFTKIIEAEAKIFSGLPYEHYSFIFHVEEGRGGLEHANSSVNFIRRWSFNDEKRYKSLLSLVSHEFFHTWNVKRIAPKGVASFDYDQENYLDELWMAEGFTSYYDELILQRIGHIDKDAYLDVLKDEINTLEKRPGKNHQSVAEASYDAWIKYYRSNEHSSNSTISYYNKGHLLGLLLDIKIIAATGGQKNLDDVMFNLNKDFALKNKGYTSDDVRKTCEAVSGLKLNTFFQDYVFGVEPLPYDEVFALAGLDLDSTEEKSSHLGINMRDRSGRIMITSVTENSPAWDAGLNVHDELVAIDGFRVKSVSPDYFREKVPGDRIICTVSRNGILQDLHLTVGFKPTSISELKQIEEPDENQKLVFEKWLGVPWLDESQDILFQE
ncbi:MAG: M61 family metallopeptidase [Candidatus Marinimicrobia bacterium]|jgi:predicted metalloprotease with PDZ domain|nr:M61 family metallopeptidase [Candidatus Neomarinimicrobiota bacterium]MBT4361072.1 M61 family metallopeptidase [Candidatus Neomarinimicrobiota bacterium]MBT4713494.1 M61 family metallopeptidase [Candidatus Neomarinimicrobiota bacterium]MBT4946694.1 M61 family metallopeptidase [Candidatus Neomarinimicrobiota bacterium]MBT5268689.1 M61 family metallopeptidase [Candidatus Neomarinimicrobiota bacterium]